jgi:hypothetical protein
MDTKLEYDIAYIKSAVSGYVHRDAQIATLNERIARLGQELQDYRSKVHELALFQSVLKGALFGLDVMALCVLIFKAVTASVSDPSTDPARKPNAALHSDAMRSAEDHGSSKYLGNGDSAIVSAHRERRNLSLLAWK